MLGNQLGYWFSPGMEKIILVAYVASVYLIMERYSRNLLLGDSNRSVFLWAIRAAVLSILFLICSDSVILICLASIALSFSLNKMIGHNTSRPASRRAAATQILVFLTSDLLLLIALVIISLSTGSIFLQEIQSSLERGLDASSFWAVAISSIMLVISMSLKSGLAPFHGWLEGTLEAPTPVSAFLHAGVVNLAAIIFFKMAFLFVKYEFAFWIIALLGAVSAIVGAISMLVQSDYKRTLVYSTISQMGFMFIQCSMGFFSGAILHMMLHGLYKAHLFLSSGDAVKDYVNSLHVPSPVAERSFPILGAMSGLTVVAVIMTIAGALIESAPTTLFMLFVASVLFVGLVIKLTRAIPERFQLKPLFLVCTTVIFLTSLYLYLSFLVEKNHIFADTAISSTFFCLFLTISVLTSFELSRAARRITVNKALYVIALNGAYGRHLSGFLTRKLN